MDKHRQIKTLKNLRMKWEKEKIENKNNVAHLADRAITLIDKELEQLEK